MPMKTKTVKGVLFDGVNMKSVNVDVRFTSDEKGKTLSLTADNKVQIGIAFEDIEKMLKN